MAEEELNGPHLIGSVEAIDAGSGECLGLSLVDAWLMCASENRTSDEIILRQNRKLTKFFNSLLCDNFALNQVNMWRQWSSCFDHRAKAFTATVTKTPPLRFSLRHGRDHRTELIDYSCSPTDAQSWYVFLDLVFTIH